MKVIRYKFLSCEVNHGTKDEPIIEPIYLKKQIPYSEANEELAKREAYNGDYTIEDDGQTETSTQLDRIEAQIAYTALMTDTLISEE